jgi:hypothetical protein
MEFGGQIVMDFINRNKACKSQEPVIKCMHAWYILERRRGGPKAMVANAILKTSDILIHSN